MSGESILNAGGKGTILYIGGFELPDKNAAAHRVLNNAKLFRKLGYNTVFVGIDKGEYAQLDILETKTEIQGFTCYSIRYPHSAKDWFSYINEIANYKTVLNTLSNVLAVVCYNFPAFAMDKMFHYCHQHDMLCLADITEWYGGGSRILPLRIIKDYESHRRMYNIHKKLDGLIVISRYLESFYKESNVFRLPPLTDLDEIKWKNGNSKSKDTLKICYAGSPGAKDKIDVLIAAVPAIKRNIRIDIIGISKKDYLKIHPEHSDIIEDERVAFQGKLPHIETLDFVKAANYSCFFREKNRVTMAGFPTKFSEAISSGTPVITNDSSDVKDYIEESVNGMIVSDLSAAAIARSIEDAGYTMQVKCNTFDYREYLSKFGTWFEDLLQVKGKSNA